VDFDVVTLGDAVSPDGTAGNFANNNAMLAAFLAEGYHFSTWDGAVQAGTGTAIVTNMAQIGVENVIPQPLICFGAFGRWSAHVVDVLAGVPGARNARVVTIVVASPHSVLPMPTDAGIRRVAVVNDCRGRRWRC